MQDISGAADTYLPEHQGPRNVNTTNPGGYTPGPSEQKTLRLVDNLYKKAKQHRLKYDQKWLDYYKFFRGKQWKEQRPSYRHSEVINLVFQSIQSTVPIQTDARPRLEFVPRSPMDTDFSQVLNKLAESDWEKGCWLEVLTEIVYESNFYGAGFGWMEVLPDGIDGRPEIVFRSGDPFYQYPDPSAVDCNKKCKFYLEAEPVDVEVLKKDYPDKAQFIKPDVIDLTGGDKTNIDKIRFKSPVDNRTFLDSNVGYDLTDRNQTLKITCYIGPEEYESEERQESKDPVADSTYLQPGSSDPMGQSQISAPVEGSMDAEPQPDKKFANGRKIVSASGMILYDGENPYDDRKFPVERLINYTLPREFWGISEIEQLMGPNKVYNKILSFTLDVMTLMGNPIWIVDTTSGIDADNLFNRPGLVVEKEPGSVAERVEGTPLQPYILPLLNSVRKMFDDLSGAKDITKPAGDGDDTPSGEAIDAIQEAAQTRLRLKSRHLDTFLQKIGQQYVERVMQFYTAPQVVRVTGDDNGFKYFKFHVETMLDVQGNPILGDDGLPRKKAIKRDFVQNQETGKISESIDATEFEIHGKFDVRVSTGSSLPFAKNEAAEKAIKLYTLVQPPGGGVIDDEELLKALDYPNWEAVLARLNQKRAQQAQIAAQNPGPPPRK
jgi:hypothetical protein